MKLIYKLLFFAASVTTVIGCRKTENLDVDYSSFNADNPQTNTALDQWLKTNFLDAYNIEVVYRYNRYYHGNTANVTPNKLEDIQPTMQAVLDGFIGPYRKVAGETFSKKYIPKEFVLFGSYAYADSNDPGVAGTAAGGRRITLYGLNDYAPLPDGAFYFWDRQRIMHHEFGHILNQIIPIPTDFESISKGYYKQPYKDTPIDSAHKNGFVTSYASGVSTEDYAETISWLLINGQVWYDNWANTASAAGKSRLIQKEQNVITYYNNLGINFKELQREVQLYMKNTLSLNESKFPYWLTKKVFTSMLLDLKSDVYLKYGSSDVFNQVYNQVKTAVNALPNYGLTFNFMKINFTSATTVNLQISFNQGTNAYVADYPFNMNVSSATGEVNFTPNGPWTGNATLLQTSVQPMLDYLSNNTFVADWLPVSINADNYMKYGGFSVKGSPASYFYGPLAY
ncbi:hypothetical protein DBR11_25825 [Pedobacter sp. HMWF019]|uniref:substrate import-associated zinc metallohydrolase lipoprotein n=1 Tax=Pedobacter sp. HMWF019 TaxID=2056856 RepID=UPI000D3A4143|nr:substrate import-associated zinc metallohydrolase lipoprotein [Pedobacter sp. HMWF019]PTS93197.1 hypothetical protein DBR11_25825 [Pedobacter sp. HMWF019]